MGVQKSQQDSDTEKKPIGRPRKVKPVRSEKQLEMDRKNRERFLKLHADRKKASEVTFTTEDEKKVKEDVPEEQEPVKEEVKEDVQSQAEVQEKVKPKTNSNPIKNKISPPAIEKEATSIPKKPKAESPHNKNNTIIHKDTIVALRLSIFPNFFSTFYDGF